MFGWHKSEVLLKNNYVLSRPLPKQVTVKKHFTKKCNIHSCRDAFPQKTKGKSYNSHCNGFTDYLATHHSPMHYRVHVATNHSAVRLRRLTSLYISLQHCSHGYYCTQVSNPVLTSNLSTRPAPIWPPSLHM